MYYICKKKKAAELIYVLRISVESISIQLQAVIRSRQNLKIIDIRSLCTLILMPGINSVAFFFYTYNKLLKVLEPKGDRK